MGRVTSLLPFITYLVLQFTQGTVLTIFLHQETGAALQWLWFIADCLLLAFWVGMLIARRARTMTVDMPLVPVPTMAAAWALYMLLVFMPRVPWVTRVAGTCLGVSTTSSNATASSSAINSVLSNRHVSAVATLTAWDGNAMKVIISIGSTLMLLSLTIAGYGQHGMLGSKEALDYDMAEAVLGLLDGAEFLGVYWEKDVTDRCHPPGVNCSASQGYFDTLSTDQRETDIYICALEGAFGNFVIAVSVFAFVLPFFALWQFKRRSAVLKGKDVIQASDRRLSTMMASMGADTLRRMSAEHYVPSEVDETHDADGSLTAYSAQLRSRTKQQKTRNCLEKELRLLRIVYLLWDLLLVNLAGGVLRFVLWLKYTRSISTLITKNILVVLFRCVNIVTEFIIPCVQKYRSVTDADEDADIDKRRAWQVELVHGKSGAEVTVANFPSML